MSFDHLYPTIEDLRRKARRRLPGFVWGYLEGGAGNEAAHARAEAAMEGVTLRPGLLAGDPAPDMTTTFLGQTHALPFGIAPVGMSGVVWADAERILARAAREASIPFGLSTVAAATPEDVSSALGPSAWFQLYAPRDPEIRRDILRRAKEAGFTTLVFTLDVPLLSRRPRELRARLANPMKLTPRVLVESALHPAWATGHLGRPIPRPAIFDPYTKGMTPAAGDKHIGLTLRCAPDWSYLGALRDEWEGPLIVKGVLDAEDALRLREAGADAIWVSNHGGRQFEAAPAPLPALVDIRKAVGPDVPLIADGAVRSGTDVLRTIALGADFVMLGRAFHYGLAAAGIEGVRQVVHILSEEIRLDMVQMGINRPVEARGRAQVTWRQISSLP